MGLQVLITVIGVEAALDRPGRTHVPFADHPRAVAGLLEQLGDGDVVVEQVAGVSRTALGRGLGADEVADARFVRMQAGDERRTRRATARGVIAFLETRAGLGQAVQVRRRNLAAVGAEVRVAEIIGEDDEHVRTVGRSERERAGRQEETEDHGVVTARPETAPCKATTLA